MQTREIIDRKGSKRRYTDEGFLVVPSRIARTGIQEYLAYELGLHDGDPLRVIRVYRSPDEVFHPDAVASFENKPITDDHPSEMVSAANWKDLAKGFGRNVRRDGDYLMADLVLTDSAAIDKLVAGKVELSNGYMALYDFNPGTTPQGEQYDAQQRNIRGNHIALVDAARCGPTCRVSDTNPQGVPTMAVKVTIDGIPFELDEAAAAAVNKLQAERDSLRQARDTAPKMQPLKLGDATVQVSDAEAVLKALNAKDTEIEALKKDVMTPDQRDAMVETWAKITSDAKRLVADFDTKGKTCDEIRREVIEKLSADGKHKTVIDAALAGVAAKDAAADVIKLTFNVLAAQPSADGKTDPVAAALRQQQDADSNSKGEEPARASHVQAISDAWKPKTA